MAKKRKTKKNSSWSIRFLTIILPSIVCLASLVGGVLLYSTRTVPDLGEEVQVTTLPKDVSRVLGAQVGPHTTPDTSLRIPIFMYHYVEYVHNDPGRQKLTTPPNILQAQIETLKENGYTFLLPDDVAKALASHRKLPQKSIILSFDDGYMDLYTDVFPILQKENVPAVAYIIPDLLNRPNYLFIFQLEALAKSPLIEIGAHTMDHPALAGMNLPQATYQIAQSRKFLQDLLHLPINSFAYPYGSFDLQAIQIVKNAGFTSAMSTIPGIEQTIDNTYFLYRLRPGYRTGQALLDYLQQDTFQPW